jgi:hypothetical protein
MSQVKPRQRNKRVQRNPRGRCWAPNMYLDPAGTTPGFHYSVLRRSYNGVQNDAAEFIRQKLFPIGAPPAGDWRRPFTCLRYDVLLPPGAVDALMCPERLVEAYQRHLFSWRNGLLCVLKVDQPVTEPLHSSYERVRQAARTAFALKRNLPVLVIAHAPFLSGASATSRGPHCHVLGLTAELSILGFTSTNDEITSDAGHLPLYREFREFGAVP